MAETSTADAPGASQPGGVRPGATTRFEVPADHAGDRLDVVTAALVPGVSRSSAQRLIEAGLVLVDGRRRPQGFRLAAGAELSVTIPETPPRPEPAPGTGFDVPVLFEDESVLVIDKRAGLVVHPGAGHRSGTLTDMLRASGRTLSVIGGEDRPGLVHRLDKETSGVMLVAKTDAAHEALARQFKDRTIRKAYLAVVLGPGLPDRGTIASSFGRNPSERKQFTSRVAEGREAVTEFRTLLRGALCAVVLARPRTGRTHQIRVHLAERGHPVVGDRVYGRAYPRPGSRPEAEAEALRRLGRHALHAFAIGFRHPVTGEPIALSAPPPRDIAEVLSVIFGQDWADALPGDPLA